MNELYGLTPTKQAQKTSSYRKLECSLLKNLKDLHPLGVGEVVNFTSGKNDLPTSHAFQLAFGGETNEVRANAACLAVWNNGVGHVWQLGMLLGGLG
jgi:hypothetical protein